jgi:hypothetical protein
MNSRFTSFIKYNTYGQTETHNWQTGWRWYRHIQDRSTPSVPQAMLQHDIVYPRCNPWLLIPLKDVMKCTAASIYKSISTYRSAASWEVLLISSTTFEQMNRVCMLLAFQWLEDLLHKLITRAPRWLQCGRNNGSVVSLMLRGHSIFLERLFFFFFFF